MLDTAAAVSIRGYQLARGPDCLYDRPNPVAFSYQDQSQARTPCFATDHSLSLKQST